jgi:acyl carrier protein
MSENTSLKSKATIQRVRADGAPELSTGFEEEFGCEIDDAAASAILTIGDAVRFIEKQAA